MVHGKRRVVTLVLLIGAFCFVTETVGAPSGAEDRLTRGPRLLMVWHDAHGLAPNGTFRGMVREVEKLFAPVGLEIEWLEAEVEDPPLDENTILLRIVLVPSKPSGSGWGLEKDVMGAFLPGGGRSHSLYIFYRNLVRAVKIHDRPSRLPDIRELRRLSRALGRVVAHEMIHAVAPTAQHASGGLMRKGLAYSFLVNGEVALEKHLIEAFLLGVDGLLAPSVALTVAPAVAPPIAMSEGVSARSAPRTVRTASGLERDKR